jgi:hypothetical protein
MLLKTATTKKDIIFKFMLVKHALCQSFFLKTYYTVQETCFKGKFPFFFPEKCVIFLSLIMVYFKKRKTHFILDLNAFYKIIPESKFCRDPAISLHSNTGPLVQCSTRLLPIMREPGSIPRGALIWNRDSPVSIGDPDVIDHCGLVWGRLSPEPSLGCRTYNLQCDNPTWSHTALLSGFHARCRSSFRLHNQHSLLLGGGGPVERIQSHCIHTQFHW